MKLIQSASKWGNLYRFRYYYDGKQISKAKAEWLLAGKHIKSPMEKTSYGFRIVWEIKA